MGGTGSEHDNCHDIFEELIRNSEYSKLDNLKKLSVPEKILKFLIKNVCMYCTLIQH